MARTDKFRRQHEEILVLARKIAALLGETIPIEDASLIRSLMLQLSGKVTMHLAMEDKSFYPSLVDSHDSSVRSLAKEYMDEMGVLATTFGHYMTSWTSAGAISDAAAAFSVETKNLFNALSKRIARENKHLYDLVDAMP